MGKNKRAAVEREPKGGKRPAAAPDQDRRRPGCFAWSFSRIDVDGRWSWHNLTRPEAREVYGQLAGMEQRTWLEAAGTGSAGTCKAIPITSLCRDAQDRLVELQIDDQDVIWEIRLGGQPRVWGIRAGDLFCLLWWDPDHEVCPSKKKPLTADMRPPRAEAVAGGPA